MINTTPKERQPEKLRGTKEMKTTAKEKKDEDLTSNNKTSQNNMKVKHSGKLLAK